MTRAVIPYLLALCFCSCSTNPTSRTNADALPLQPEEFAILPWGWTPGDPNALREIRECGFNLAGFVSPENLDLVGQARLKCIVSDGNTNVGDTEAKLGQQEIDRRVAVLVKRIGEHSAVFGYYLRDEPSAEVFPGLKNWVKSYQAAAPKALAYINLFPNYASPAQMRDSTYEGYVESYVRTVQPKFISYDHYALMDDGSLRAGYFQNLESVRAAALRHNIPFWNIVLSNSHFHYAEPTEAGLRFQLYTTLAYGGKGISYFTYFAPTAGNYRLAPIDQFGNKTQTWEMLRNVNLQLHRIGRIYITLRSVNVFHHPDVPQGCSGIQSSQFVSDVRGGSLLVGEFVDPEGRPFVIVVNKSLQRSTWFHISFKEQGQIMQVNSYTGRIEPWSGENDWLAAGQGMMLCIKKQ